MEILVLTRLGHTLHIPTSMTFLRQLHTEFKFCAAAAKFCCYLAELSLLQYSFVSDSIHPSFIATAIACLTAILFKIP